MSKTMRAVVVEADAPLVLASVDRPETGPNEVLIRVAASGLNRADLLQRAGMYPPPKGASDIMGLECAGEIAEIGSDVTGWSVGDKVCALLAGGGYAEYAAVDAGSLLPIPDGWRSRWRGSMAQGRSMRRQAPTRNARPSRALAARGRSITGPRISRPWCPDLAALMSSSTWWERTMSRRTSRLPKSMAGSSTSPI